MRTETWQLIDTRNGAALGTRAYPTLSRALDVRRGLLQSAANISPEFADEVRTYCDIRRVI